MKNRKLLLVVSLVLALTMSLGGTLAYLTDTDENVNVMTLGKVDIEQLENGEDGPIDIDPLYPAYIDGDKINGSIEKEITVTNVGPSDAYIRTVFAFEAGQINSLEDFKKLIVAKFAVEDKVDWLATPVTIGEDKYFLATYVYDGYYVATETTPASLLYVYMDPQAKNDDVTQFGSEYKILVVSQAVQTNNMEELGAKKALEVAFGEISADQNPWTGEDAASTEQENAPDLIITNVAQLRAFRDEVNAGNNYYGKIVALGADLDLNGAEWEPIGNNEAVNTNARAATTATAKFSGTFDGQNHTISNFKVDVEAYGGLFGNVQSATIKNLTVANATINSNHFAGGIAGHGVCAKISNCHVKNSNITAKVVNNDNGDKVGGIVGYLAADGGSAYIKNCSVINTKLTAYRDLGGIVGCVSKDGNYAPEIVNCTVSGNDLNQVIGEGAENYKNLTEGEKVGEIYGDDRGGNVVVDGSEVAPLVKNDAALDKAIAEGATTVVLSDGNYIIPDSAKGKTLTIIGNGETVIATQDDGSYEGCDYSLDGATVTFENITINTDSSTYTGYARLNATYNNCTINGTYTLYGDSVFNNCTFNVSGDVYNIWTWGAPNATFNNCTFNSDGKAMLLYSTVNTKLTIDNCEFNDKGGLTDLKAAIEIGNDYNKSYELIVNNTTVNGYEINDKGISTGTTLWGNKNSMGTDKLNVVVDGVDVY